MNWLGGILIAITILTPLTAFLQWALPQDGPAELLVLAAAAPLVGCLLGCLNRAWTQTSGRRFLVLGLALFIWLPPLWGDPFVSLFTLGPIVRKVAVWHALSTLLPFALFALGVLMGLSGVVLACRWVTLRVLLALGQSVHQFGIRLTAATLLPLLLGVELVVFVPEVSRRVGPWAELRRILLEGQTRVVMARQQLGIPEERPLIGAELSHVRAVLPSTLATFRFPIVGKTAAVRVMQTRPPYVGVDYGNGRNVVFDLRSMRMVYVD